MEIHCPHALLVSVEEMHGVIVYSHPDGKSCTLMNNFNTSGQRILAVMAENAAWEDTPEVRAALAVGGQAKEKAYRLIVDLKNDGLRQFLVRILTMYSEFTDSVKYFRDLVNAFGPVMADNIKLLTGLDVRPLLIEEEDKVYMKVQDLRKAQINTVNQQMQRDLDQLKNRINSAIEQTRRSPF